MDHFPSAYLKRRWLWALVAVAQHPVHFKRLVCANRGRRISWKYITFARMLDQRDRSRRLARHR